MWNAAFIRRRKLGRGSTRGMIAASKTGLRVWCHDKNRPIDGLDLVIRWGCTANVNCRRVLNTAEAIHLVSDKTEFRKILNENNLCTPSYFTREDAVNALEEDATLVVRPRVHAQGRRLFVVNTAQELDNAIARCGAGWYANDFFNKTAEYRISFCQGRVVWVAKKTPANPADVAWNVAQGGRFDNVRFDEWPLKAVRISREAFILSRLDFGAVDVMVDDQNNVFVLEINSAPSQTSPYRQECFAKAFDYIVTNENKEAIPIIPEKGDWKKFVHPAVSEKAILHVENP